MPVFSTLPRRFGRVNQIIFVSTWLLMLPLLGWGQTTIVNYDFNTATAYPVAPVSTAPGVTSVATSSQGFAVATGTVTGAGAYTANTTPGNALNMTTSSTSERYFEFALNGVSLPKYSVFKVYLQGRRPPTGAANLTLQYSLNGGSYVTSGTYTPGTDVFTEGVFDLSSAAALNTPASLSFRLTSGTSGAVRIDNFQVQAVNTVDPTINSLTPSMMEAGSPAFTLTVGGRNFQSGAVINFNGQDLLPSSSSPTSLTATVPAAAVATPGNYPVTVTNPAAGGTTSLPATFVVTPAVPHWTGAAGTSSWFDARNWSTGQVPGAADEVLLDHRDLAGRYTVSLDQNVSVSIKSLTVNPEAGDSIFVLVPATNTAEPALALSNAGTGAVALSIRDKGVVTNASGAAAGPGVDVAGTGATVFIYNGGSYRHASGRGHADVAENLSVAAGTELGVFDFRLPANGSASYTVATTVRAYGTLIFRNRPGAATSGYRATGSSLTVRGNLLIAPNVTLTATINNDLRLAGDLRAQGTLQFRNTTPASPTSQLLMAGTKPQTISGSVLLDPGIGLAINNPTGVTLAAALALNGPLNLTSGLLTTSATNLLTLNTAATVVGGSNTSFVNGPLARLTGAGAVSNLLFPTGSGTAYRPLTLNATAQDATTYLVMQTEGRGPEVNNRLPGTAALPKLAHVSRIRSYTITAAPAANNFSGTVTLSFGPDDQVNAPADAGLVVGRNSGPGWENVGNSGVNVTTPAPMGGFASGTITSGTLTAFGSFALARTNDGPAPNPLPVTLTAFGARRHAAGVALNWATATELNNARFDVQRSPDGRAFLTVATVAGHGTTAQPHAYTALDQAAPAGPLYYRLAQVDTDGQVSFSSIVALNAAAQTTKLAPYPNPVRDQLTVPAPAGTTVQVFDLTGRVLQTSALPPSGAITVSGLPAGSYLLRGTGGQVWRFSKE